MKKIILVILVAITGTIVAQEKKPKLVVGIVIDQMRYDYLNRFWNKFGDDGFKKLINNGFNCQNTHFNYMPTYTAPGHASIYTGTTPENHGIIGNTWFDKKAKKYTYCTVDTSVTTIGSGSKNGMMSPKNLIATTITDELKLATNFNGKVIAVSLKDRGAILPGGHKADGAYWYDGGNEGKWITSTYYMEEMPKWVQNVNTKNTANKYLSEDWNTLLPIADYTESITDDNHYEGNFTGEVTPTFPHKLPLLRDSNDNYSLIKATPFGNTIVKEMAIEAIKGEQLGKDDITDFLAISFSSTDYVGHQYGPMSVEIEDTYLRLDRELAELLKHIESQVNNDEVIIFLTADHGVVNVPQYLMDNHMPAGYFKMREVAEELNEKCKNQFGVDSLITNISNYQVFLNYKQIEVNKLNQIAIENTLASWLLEYNGVAQSFTRNSLVSTKFTESVPAIIQRGFNQVRSGDIVFALESGWIMAGYSTGTTHGSPYQYDTHVPLIWYGQNIKNGVSKNRIVISDIAATLAILLNIQAPSVCTGTPIKDILK